MMKVDKITCFPPKELEEVMRDWPASWAGEKSDIGPGEKLIEEFRPFVCFLNEQGFTRKTIRRHVDNLWAIGGEIIRDFNYDASLRKKKLRILLLNVIETGHAPLMDGVSEEKQRLADATARKFLKFIRSS